MKEDAEGLIDQMIRFYVHVMNFALCSVTVAKITKISVRMKLQKCLLLFTTVGISNVFRHPTMSWYSIFLFCPLDSYFLGALKMGLLFRIYKS